MLLLRPALPLLRWHGARLGGAAASGAQLAVAARTGAPATTL
jgi:hypothetical protein